MSDKFADDADDTGGDDEYPVTPVTQETKVRHAAVLWRGGHKINETFDFWHYTTDVKVMLKVDESRLIMADSQQELANMLDARYPTIPGCTLIDPYVGPLHIFIGEQKPGEHNWDYRRRRHGSYDRYTKYKGWVVLNTPHREEVVDRDHLRDLLVEHKVLLLSASQVEDLGGEARLMNEGFSPVPGGFGFSKIRWNPKAAGLRKWRAQVKAVEGLQIDQFNSDILNGLGTCTNPENWPSDIPFSHDIVSSHAGGGYTAQHILNLIALARRLRPGSTPWRSPNRGTSIREVIARALPYIRYIIKNGHYDSDKKLAKWLLREAKVAKLTVPPAPVIPPEPFKKKRRNLHATQGRSAVATAERVSTEAGSGDTILEPAECAVAA